MSRANWPEQTLDSDVGSPRLYDAGDVQDRVDILVARRSILLPFGDDSAPFAYTHLALPLNTAALHSV